MVRTEDNHIRVPKARVGQVVSWQWDWRLPSRRLLQLAAISTASTTNAKRMDGNVGATKINTGCSTSLVGNPSRTLTTSSSATNTTKGYTSFFNTPKPPGNIRNKATNHEQDHLQDQRAFCLPAVLTPHAHVPRSPEKQPRGSYLSGGVQAWDIQMRHPPRFAISKEFMVMS